MAIEIKNINITKQLPIIEFSVNKTYAYKMKEKEKPESANIRLIIQPDFDETGYKNIEEIKKDLQFIFEQANRYFD